MTRPPRARETVLDAFETLLLDGGARAATVDATARAAGVSKGGLLYHYATKEALEEALLHRLDDLVSEDLDLMMTAPEGAVAYFLRTSVTHNDALDRTIVAVSRVAQDGSAAAGAALRAVRERWEQTLRPHVRDEAALHLVMLVSDGLYFNNAMDYLNVPAPVPEGAALDAVIALVEASVR